MAYFDCIFGGGSSGGGYELTVTCDSAFSGTTITCTDGITTLTQTCPSASPYEVVFEIPNGGTWTVSGTISGSTYTASIDIPDSLELLPIPEGSTVLPTDDIQTWLACSNIFDKSYTTLNEVLADSTTLLALMSNNNAVDYLVRSTTWASGVTANSTAMTDIGANDYCANTLLSDSTWLNAICDSTYFESVLNVKVPTMTSNTTPSGVASAGTEFNGRPAYKAFDNNASTNWTSNITSTSITDYIQYKFDEPTIISRYTFVPAHDVSGNTFKRLLLQGSNTGNNDWELIDDHVEDFAGGSGVRKDIRFNISNSYLYFRLTITVVGGTSSYWCQVDELQFYGRADV